ncbi:MAG: DUF2029 domain-containing protein [Anaerolineae bacterium]|nr:DUF2029 domain-containing protein [Anaerolineae bacterium]
MLWAVIRRRRRVLLWGGFAIALALLAVELRHWAAAGFALSVDDFVEYWAAGRLYLSKLNPYDPLALLKVQETAGWLNHRPLMMWNPPWTLAVVIPFSALVYRAARLIWFLVQSALILAGGGVLWHLYRPEDKRWWLGGLVGVCFAPSLFAMGVGQISPMLFGGWVAFLWLVRHRRDILAGIALFFVTFKPHLLYLFWIFLLLWTWRTRRWRVLAGLAAALVVAMLTLTAYSPALVWQYVTAMVQRPPLYWATPTLGTLLRLIFGYDRGWLQFVPSLIGALWGLVLAGRWGERWNWMEAGPLILLLSLVTSAYGWSFDQIMLLPAVIRSGALVLTYPRRRWMWVFGFVVFEGVALAQNIARLNDVGFVWVAPVWLCLYLLLLPAERWHM